MSFAFLITTKKLLACVATALAALGFFDRHRCGPKDLIRDKWWKPTFHFHLGVAVCWLISLCGWFCLATDSPAARPWTTLEVIASAAAIGGAVLRLWAIATLGRLFTFQVSIRQNHELVSTGPYRILLHPSYTGAVCGLAGLVWLMGGPGLWLRQAWLWAIGLPCCVVLVGARVINEEETLAAHFGDAWRRYASTRWRMVPLIW